MKALDWRIKWILVSWVFLLSSILLQKAAHLFPLGTFGDLFLMALSCLLMMSGFAFCYRALCGSWRFVLWITLAPLVITVALIFYLSLTHLIESSHKPPNKPKPAIPVSR